jgi:transcriptional regulator with XRE-family HTH domain
MTIKYRRAREVLDEILGPVSFGQFLNSLRLSLEFTQVQFALKLKISKQELCDIEKGRKLVSVDRAVDFARRLKHSEKLFAKYVIEDQLRKSGLNLRVHFDEAA